MAVFALFILDLEGQRIPVRMVKATAEDLRRTTAEPKWQTDRTDPYITQSNADVYALKTRGGELVALGAYETREDVIAIHIVYMESQTQSDPTLCPSPKYRGIGRALVAYGIKLSVDAGFNGDVTLDAKTPELAQHYERDFGAVHIPGREKGGPPRYLICDEAARDIFTDYLEEEQS